MVKRKIVALEKVEADLSNLQNKIRRDPLSYEEDFKAQWNQYLTSRQLFLANPASASTEGLEQFRSLIDFIAHVADCYPKITSTFASDISELLLGLQDGLDLELREKLVGSLVLIRKKEMIDSSSLLSTLFPLLISTPSKSLRTFVYTKIISDVRSSNSNTKNHKLNRTLQTILFNLLTSDRSSPKAIWAVRITKELWRRQIWTDAKAVEIMKEATFSDNVKVIVAGVNFFLGGDKEREEAAEESDDDGEALDMGKLRHQAGINKKTRKKERELKTAAAAVKKKERKKNKPHPLNFSAFHLLHDPQSTAETLFSRHLKSKKSKLNLEQKLMVLQLVSRLVGLHELIIEPLYSYFLDFLKPSQTSVTSFLASLAQSVHKKVPPDFLERLLVKIANEFVSEASASQVAAAGLNSIREISARQPLAMNDTLLQDLVMYRKSKDKGVMMAAKGLLSLYRDVGPDKLRRRDRGKEAALQMKGGDGKHILRFGEVPAGEIEGLDLLEKYKEDERRRKREEMGLPAEQGDGEEEEEEDEAEDWKAWEVEQDDSDDSGGWIAVESDGEDINISDSDDDDGGPAAKKQKIKVVADADADAGSKETPNKPEATAGTASTVPASETSKLATSRILTPADLAKLNELRMEVAISSRLPASQRREKQQQQQVQQAQKRAAAASAWHADNPVTAESLVETATLGQKSSREERIRARKEGQAEGGGDGKHVSTTAMRKQQRRSEGKSTTNKDKARQKNFFMTLGKARVKQKRSLRDVRRSLKAHVDRKKRGGKRGNVGS